MTEPASEELGESEVPDLAKDLSREQLMDLVPVFTARSAPEAAFIQTLLEDLGYPTVLRGIGVLTFESTNAPRILVPRALAEKAKAEIAQAREDATRRGVERAFVPSAPDEEETSDEPKDQVIEKIKDLLETRRDERDYWLRELIEEWLSADVSPVRMAEYLAAAGLTLEEGEALVREVGTERQEQIVANRKSKAGWAPILLILAVLLTLVTFTMAATNTVGFYLVWIPTGALWWMYVSNKPIRKSLLNEEKPGVEKPPAP